MPPMPESPGKKAGLSSLMSVIMHSDCHHERRHRRRVGERRADNLKRINHASLNHVRVFVRRRIVTHANVRLRQDLFDDYGAFDAGVLSDGTKRALDRFANDLDANFLIENLQRIFERL